MTVRGVAPTAYNKLNPLNTEVATNETLFKKVCPYISVDGVDFTAMKRRCGDLDYMQKQLLSIAHNLISWTSNCKVTPHNLACLGYPMLDYVCSAFYIANGTVRVQVRENNASQPEFILDMNRYKQNKKICDKILNPASWPQDLEPEGLSIG